jgi:hypothetical protein
VLTPHDDFPIHQTPLPIAHPASGSPYHADRYWFNGFPRDGSDYIGVKQNVLTVRGLQALSDFNTVLVTNGIKTNDVLQRALDLLALAD